jgi:16S rRNA (adenine1518-N6/adenine1519-N6)-dimethyltransferase
MKPKKSLGQHWLYDEETLNYIVGAADVSVGDTVLEIGPGTGTLTKKLLDRGAKVIAVEKDEKLAADLYSHDNLRVAEGDILKFDLSGLPPGYKVVANIPYYLTSNLLRVLSESSNPPSVMVLLVQKEVAERIAAKAGQMSILSVSVQLYYEPSLGQLVPAKLFTPPPKVDSQVVILQGRSDPLFPRTVLGNKEAREFFKVVKAGFSQRRKKLRGSLSGGLHISKDEADALLQKASIDGDLRAQELSLEQWYKLSKQ